MNCYIIYHPKPQSLWHHFSRDAGYVACVRAKNLHLAKFNNSRSNDYPDVCPLCEQEDESISHFLPDCTFSRKVLRGV